MEDLFNGGCFGLFIYFFIFFLHRLYTGREKTSALLLYVCGHICFTGIASAEDKHKVE